MGGPIVVSESVKRYDFDGDKKADVFKATITRYEDASTEDGYRDEVVYSAVMTKRGAVDEATLRSEFGFKDRDYGGVEFDADVAFSKRTGHRAKFDGVKEHVEAVSFSFDSDGEVLGSINDTAYVDPNTKGGKRLMKVYSKAPQPEDPSHQPMKFDVQINKTSRAAVSLEPDAFDGKIYVDFEYTGI